MALRLRENVNNVGPAEGTERPTLDVKVAGTSPALRRLPTSVDVFPAEGGVEGAESFPDGAVFPDVKEMTGAGAHLTLGFLNEEGLGDPYIGGTLPYGYGCDMTSKERTVGGGSNYGSH